MKGMKHLVRRKLENEWKKTNLENKYNNTKISLNFSKRIKNKGMFWKLEEEFKKNNLKAMTRSERELRINLSFLRLMFIKLN